MLLVMMVAFFQVLLNYIMLNQYDRSAGRARGEGSRGDPFTARKGFFKIILSDILFFLIILIDIMFFLIILVDILLGYRSST